MRTTLHAICDQPLPKSAEVPEWVHLLPAGRALARDGREFILSNAGNVIAAFQDGGIDLPVDYEHQADKDKASGPVPAAGWIKDLAMRKDGLWGRVEWTARAREMIGNREYRYLSPSVILNAATREIMRVVGAGLVHKPALHLTALASEETEMDATAALIKIAELMGLPPEATPDQVIAELQAGMDKLRQSAKPKEVEGATMAQLAAKVSQVDPAQYVPLATVREMLAERNTENAAAREDRVQRKVQDAVQNGHISPAMKGWATELCRANEPSFDAFLADSGAVFAQLLKPVTFPAQLATSRQGAASVEALEICRQLGLKPEALSE